MVACVDPDRERVNAYTTRRQDRNVKYLYGYVYIYKMPRVRLPATRPSTPTASTTTVDKFRDHKYHYERRRDKYLFGNGNAYVNVYRRPEYIYRRRVPLLPLPSPEYNYRLRNDYFLYFLYDLEPPRNARFKGITRRPRG